LQAGVSRDLNKLALADHLRFRWPDPEETYYEAVRRVPRGSLVYFHDGQRVLRRYWNVNPIDLRDPGNELETAERFQAALDRAVARAVDGAAAGIFLSGGLDSVSVAAVAADLADRKGRGRPVALSLGFPDPSCNEEEVQREIARCLHLDQEYLTFEEATKGRPVLGEALALAEQWPVPMSNMWNGGYAPLAQRGAECGCSVILTGTGGDEWLTVGPYLAADLMKALDIRAFVKHVRTLQRSYNVSPASQLRSALWNFGARALIGSTLARMAPRWVSHRRVSRVAASTPRWVAPDPGLRRAIDDRIEASLPAANPPHGFYWRESLIGLEHPLVSMDLEEHYELGRRAGVRLRHPYWDVDLVELLMRTPPSLLNGKGKSKGLVRQALSDRFPQLGFERQKKIGATSYFQNLVLKEGPELWRAAEGARTLVKLGIVNADALNARVAKLFAGAEPARLYEVWEVLRLERWVRAHL
jgi:asparagine synthase (glutamine-hydrolysing)